MSLQNIIETAFENRAEITPASVSTEVKNAVLETLRQLDSGAWPSAWVWANGR